MTNSNHSDMDTFTRLMQSLPTLERTLSSSERAMLSSFVAENLISPVPKELEFLFSSAESFLEADELDVYRQLDATHISLRGVLRSHTFMIMKATRLCNLRCTYCHSWRDGPNQSMSFSVLAKATHDVLRARGAKRVEFVWHGGEVTLLPILFFKKALWLQHAFKTRDQVIVNSLQTNATRLTDEWVQFLKIAEFQVGVSLDGPPELHNSRRIKLDGTGSWQEVVKGIEKLQHAGLPIGVLVVIDEKVVRYGAKKLLEALVELGVKGVALLNVIPDNLSQEPSNDGYLPWPSYVSFLRDVLPIWWNDYRKDISIRELDALVNNVSQGRPTICEFAGNCMGQFLTIDPNGDVSACDKYIGDAAFVFGNLRKTFLPDLLADSRNLLAARQEAKEGSRQMKACKYYRYCNGGCPHDVKLNQRHLADVNSNCCGLSSLMEDIEMLLRRRASIDSISLSLEAIDAAHHRV